MSTTNRDGVVLCDVLPRMHEPVHHDPTGLESLAFANYQDLELPRTHVFTDSLRAPCESLLGPWLARACWAAARSRFYYHSDRARGGVDDAREYLRRGSLEYSRRPTPGVRLLCDAVTEPRVYALPFLVFAAEFEYLWLCREFPDDCVDPMWGVGRVLRVVGRLEAWRRHVAGRERMSAAPDVREVETSWGREWLRSVLPASMRGHARPGNESVLWDWCCEQGIVPLRRRVREGCG